jgi:hypothetical protein
MGGVQTVPEQRYQRLLEYLEDGWAIDPPVFVRPVWHTLHRAQDAYHFILKRADALHLLVVPTSPEVEQFVRGKQLPLNRL